MNGKIYLIGMLLSISLFAGGPSASAELRLVVPVATAHIEYSHKDYNNDIRGLGVEYVAERNVFGAFYMEEDSQKNENLYLYYGREFSEEISVAGFVAFGYKTLILAPLVSVQYKWVRIVTSFPFVGITPRQTVGADIVQIQMVIPLEDW